MVTSAAGGRTTREGELLGAKYVLMQLLGAGGMGEVWRAMHVDMGREVAVKVLREEHAENPEIAERFLREARTANLVRHPNVVDVLDVGRDDRGAPFLVQELLEGEDLARHIAGQGGRLALEPAMAILLPVVDAVAFAHAKGVVHRDLKPENVFLARHAGSLVPKLLDFGISHVLAGNGPRMTATGMAVGTPAYMAPEQIRGLRQVDPRTDVWALGVMIHEVLAGALPFVAETSADMFVQIATADPIPLQVAAPDVPLDVARIVARCLSRDPERRCADAAEVLDLLRLCRPSAAVRRDAVALSVTEPVAVAPPERLARPAPIPLAPRFASSRPIARLVSSLAPSGAALDMGRVLTAFAAVLLALAGAGVLTLWNPWPEGWSLTPLLVETSSDGVLERALPWMAACALLLLAAVALRFAVRAWFDRARVFSVVLVAVGTFALFAASQFVRERGGHLGWYEPVGLGGGQ